jgi:hypothetical protein
MLKPPPILMFFVKATLTLPYRYRARQRPRPEPSFLDDNVTSKQTLAKPLHGSVQTGPFEEIPFRSNTHQYETGHYHVQAKDKLAEILIFGQQKSLFVIRSPQKRCIGRSRRDFGRVDHIVPAVAKVTHERCIDAFVGKPPHAPSGQR